MGAGFAPLFPACLPYGRVRVACGIVCSSPILLLFKQSLWFPTRRSVCRLLILFLPVCLVPHFRPFPPLFSLPFPVLPLPPPPYKAPLFSLSLSAKLRRTKRGKEEVKREGRLRNGSALQMSSPPPPLSDPSLLFRRRLAFLLFSLLPPPPFIHSHIRLNLNSSFQEEKVNYRRGVLN